jgi:transposase
MKKKRGVTAYSDEFRREAVRLVESGKSDLVQVAKDLGVHPDSLRSWCRRAAQPDLGTLTGPSRVLLEEENRRLRRENERLKEERDILKNWSYAASPRYLLS